MPYAQLHLPLGVGDHCRTLGLGTRARRRGNTNQLGKFVTNGQYRALPIKIKLPDVAVIVGGQGSRLTRIHATPSTDGDNGIMPALTIHFPRRRNVGVLRIRRNIGKNITVDTRGLQRTLQRTNKWQLSRSAIRHDKRVGQPHVHGSGAQFSQPARAVSNRNRERPVTVRKQIFRIFINHLKIDPHNLNNTLSRPEYRYEKKWLPPLKKRCISVLLCLYSRGKSRATPHCSTP